MGAPGVGTVSGISGTNAGSAPSMNAGSAAGRLSGTSLALADERASAAIDAAKESARQLGIDFSRGRGNLSADPSNETKVSYSYEIHGLKEPAEVEILESAFHQIPGVRAKILYTEHRGWISAPMSLPLGVINKVFAEAGVEAGLTDDALRRRLVKRSEAAAKRLHNHDEEFRSQQGWYLRRSRRQADLEMRRAQAAGWVAHHQTVEDDSSDWDDDPEVLFTARALTTRRRLVVSLLLTIPVLLLSRVQELQFSYWQWVVAALALPVVVWGAWPFHRAALGGLRRGLPALDAASAVAIVLAFGWSSLLLLVGEASDPGWHSSTAWLTPALISNGHQDMYFDVACGMTVLLLLGRLLTQSTQSSLLDEVNSRLEEMHGEFEVVHRNRKTGKREQAIIHSSEFNVGDDVTVSAGHYLPADGTIIGGSGVIADGHLSGLIPEGSVKVSSQVYAGSWLESGQVKVRVTRTGHRTRLAGIRRWVVMATQAQTRFAWLATRSASMLVPMVLVAAVFNAALWVIITRNLTLAVSTTVALLSCVAPVALALSSAMATRHSIEAAARRGLLLRDGESIRALETVDKVIFNRVGTLTTNSMKVETIVAEHGENLELILRVAGALVVESQHPVSRAIIHAARESRDAGGGGESIPRWLEATNTHMDPDGSFTGIITLPGDDDTPERQVEARLWRPRTMENLHSRLAAAVANGGTPVIVAWKGKDRGVISISISERADAAEAIQKLESMGLHTMMISRDTYPVARRIADRLGIDEVLAGIETSRKPQAIREVRARGARVAIVGDDSIMGCLKVADVGILMGGDAPLDKLAGKDTGVEVVVLRQDISAIPELFSHCRKVSSIIDSNIWLAWTYNGAAAVLAILGLLPPMVATVMMLGASLLIEWRSRRVRKL